MLKISGLGSHAVLNAWVRSRCNTNKVGRDSCRPRPWQTVNAIIMPIRIMSYKTILHSRLWLLWNSGFILRLPSWQQSCNCETPVPRPLVEWLCWSQQTSQSVQSKLMSSNWADRLQMLCLNSGQHRESMPDLPALKMLQNVKIRKYEFIMIVCKSHVDKAIWS